MDFLLKVKESFKSFKESVCYAYSLVTVEPLMLLDGLAFCIMSVFIEDMQMRKICEVSLNQTSEVCSNLKNHHNISSQVQLEFSVFAFYDGIIRSLIPLFFILFMGAWSDKYGRKIPLYMVETGHFFFALTLLVFSMIPDLPVNFLLLSSLLESLGGGNVCFLTVSNAYLSDVTTDSSRTARVSLANSLYFLGGPMGTLMGKFLYDMGGYSAVFSTSLTCTTLCLLNIMFFIKESHGPNAIKPKVVDYNADMTKSVRKIYALQSLNPTKQQDEPEATTFQMIKDFFNPNRIIESFKCTLKKREGNTRTLIFLVILCSLVRRLSRSPYVFAFTKHVLSWEAGDYSLWVTFKNLSAALGSLVLVPLLSTHLQLADYVLGSIGSLSNIIEYTLYGMSLFAGPLFFWIAPISALLINACTIAQKAMLSKMVPSSELGKVSAVLGALDGVMPMVAYALFMAVYKQTVTTFPAAHFFLGASASTLMLIIFLIIMALSRSKSYDVENAQIKEGGDMNVKVKNVQQLEGTWWLARDYFAISVPLTTSLRRKISDVSLVKMQNDLRNKLSVFVVPPILYPEDIKKCYPAEENDVDGCELSGDGEKLGLKNLGYENDKEEFECNSPPAYDSGVEGEGSRATDAEMNSQMLDTKDMEPTVLSIKEKKSIQND